MHDPSRQATELLLTQPCPAKHHRGSRTRPAQDANCRREAGMWVWWVSLPLLPAWKTCHSGAAQAPHEVATGDRLRW